MKLMFSDVAKKTILVFIIIITISNFIIPKYTYALDIKDMVNRSFLFSIMGIR